MIKRSRDVSDKNAAGIEFLFKKNKIDYIRGEASLEKAGEVVVRLNGRERRRRISAAKILVATGVRLAPACRAFPSTARRSSAAAKR